MIIINDISDVKFSVDGIPYFKNYISEVAGNQITVFNAYDRNDVRIDWIDFSQITLDGVVYGSVALLQDALLPVIYKRNTGGETGGGVPEAPNNANAYVRSGLSWVIGYTKSAIDTLLNLKEDLINKVTDLSSPNNTTYPTTLAVQNAINAIPTGGTLGANLFPYKVKTTILTGDPTAGHLVYSDATQINSTQINVSNLVQDGFDVRLFLESFVIGDKLVIQDRDNSANNQVWQITLPLVFDQPTFVKIEGVTLISSEGTGTTNFANNHEVFMVRQAEVATTEPVIELTYSQLTTAIANSTLIKGQVYLLTDYMTTYTQPVTGASKSSGIVEQLYITATDVNKISNECLSKLYPQDIVFYEVTGDIGNGYGDEGFTKGKIYRRIDTIRNNDIGTDWRHVKYDRTGVDKLLFEDYTGCHGNVIKTYFLFNTVAGSGFSSNSFGNNCNSNTFGSGCYSNTFGSGCFLNTFENDCYSNTFENDCSSNSFGSGCFLNTFGKICSSNTFESDCYSNNFENSFSSNTIPTTINIFNFSKVISKDFTGLISNINTQRKVYTQANGDIIFSSVDDFGDTILTTL